MPGRRMTSAPRKPAATATHRAGVTRSPSSSGAIAVTMNGPVKLIAVAVVSGTCGSAVMKIKVEMHSSVERASCKPGRDETSRLVPSRGAKKITM